MKLRCKRLWLPVAVASLCSAIPFGECNGQTPAPPSDLQAADHGWDDGSAIDLTWKLSPDDDRLQSYQVQKAVASIDGKPVNAEFAHVEFVKPGTTNFTVHGLRPSIDIFDLADGYRDQFDIAALKANGRHDFNMGYRFRLVAVTKDAKSLPIETSNPVMPAMASMGVDSGWRSSRSSCAARWSRSF
jgi:hypothetical protein